MFKPILLCICTFFLLIVKAQSSGDQDHYNNDLSKSFTAVCENSSNCTYSLVLSTTSSSYNVDVAIFVDTVNEFSDNIIVTNASPVTVNFNVTQGSQISISFNVPAQPPGSFVRFQLYNQADGNGQLVQDSKNLKFSVLNTCTEGSYCTLAFQCSRDWVPNVFAQFKINGTIVATLNDTTTAQDVSFKAFDILSVEIVGNPVDIVDNLIVAVVENQFTLFWFSNSYFTPMLATGNCLPPSPPIPSPFGGLLIPMTQEQIDLFLKTIGTSYSTLWYRETENLF